MLHAAARCCGFTSNIPAFLLITGRVMAPSLFCAVGDVIFSYFITEGLGIDRGRVYLRMLALHV
jgi:hypothetical protein